MYAICAVALAEPVGDRNAGLTAMEFGRYDAAVRLFTRALKSAQLTREDREQAYFQRGVAYLHLRQFARAKADLRRAVAIEPRDIEAADALEMAKAGRVPEQGVAGFRAPRSPERSDRSSAARPLGRTFGSSGGFSQTHTRSAASGGSRFGPATGAFGAAPEQRRFTTQSSAGRSFGSKGVGVVATDAPLLPWPPYSPSSRGDITGLYSRYSTYGGIDAAISKRLASFGYAERSYFAIPNGFAVLTPLEQIDGQGKPVLTDRWVGRFTGPVQVDFASYVRQLLSGRHGRYRTFLFLVSDTDFAPEPDVMGSDAVKRWERGGAMTLNPEFAAQRTPQDVYVRLFVYEFTDNNSQSGGLVQQGDGSLTFSQHARSIGLAP